MNDWYYDMRIRHGLEVVTSSVKRVGRVMTITNDTAVQATRQFERVLRLLGQAHRYRAQQRSRRNQATMRRRRHGRPRGR